MLRWIKSTSFIFMTMQEGPGPHPRTRVMFRSEYTKMNEDILLQKHQMGELKLIEWSRELIQRSDGLLAQVIMDDVSM